MQKELKGRPITKKIYRQLKSRIELHKLKPKLVVIIIGKDPAAEYYVKMLEKKGKKIGLIVDTLKFEKDISQEKLLLHIKELNNKTDVNGIMIQKPLPNQINESQIISMINYRKDVDAMHPLNIGNMVLDQEGFIPCTPAAVLEMLKFYNIETQGRNIIIIGRSDIVGKPLANLFLRKNETGNATVTICHSRTKNLVSHTKKADILITAIGKPQFVKKEMIKKNSIVIDVGVNQIEDKEKGKIYVGDVDYDDCYHKSLFITPVPGGVGSVTTSLLLKNVVDACEK